MRNTRLTEYFLDKILINVYFALIFSENFKLINISFSKKSVLHRLL